MSRGNDAELLLRLAEDVKLFRTEWKEPYADIDVDGHRETWPLASEDFRDRLVERFLRSEGQPIQKTAVGDVLATLRAKAFIGGETKPVFMRVADFEGKRYLDLANDKWEAVEISATGWKIVANPPVRFCRAPGMLPLPKPARGGKIEEFRPFQGNISDDGFVLVIGWLLTVLNGRPPYPVLSFSGLQGSAKSSASRFTRNIIDPALTPLGTLPSTQAEYSRAVGQNWILAWDNVSHINDKTSDALCRLSTGGYDPHYRPGCRPCASHIRPIILNSIVNCVVRPDLADRALFVTLDPIKDKARKNEYELQAKFEKAWPRILGALLDGVAAGLANSGCNHVENIGRMVDMHQFASCCEKTYWTEGTFGAAYRASRKRAAIVLSEVNPVATGVIRLVDEQGSFNGTATELLSRLNAMGKDIRTGVKLPGGPGALSGELTRVEPLLESQGIVIDRDRTGQQGARQIFIKRLEPPNAKSRSSKPRQAKPKPAAANLQGLLPLGLPDDTDDELEPA
jgi:hypothetical protein